MSGLCSPRTSGCAVTSTTLELSGSGQSGDPYIIEPFPNTVGSYEHTTQLQPTHLTLPQFVTIPTSYVDWPPAVIGGPFTDRFVKVDDASLLVVDVVTSASSNSGVSAFTTGVNIDGVDFDLFNGMITTVHTHELVGGVMEFAGLGVGPHSLTMRAKSRFVPIIVFVDWNDYFCWTLRERAVGP